MRDFIDERFAGPPSPPSLLDADRHGFTHEEYERLQRPGGLWFAPLRWLMKGPGRLSRGIDLGWKHGFDSGIMLDYIYENRAQGLTPLGRLIDRAFLNAIGWRGIRVRRTLLEQALRSLIEQTHAAGRPVRLLDIASGPGRYVLETIHTLRTISDLCRPARLQAGKPGRRRPAAGRARSRPSYAGARRRLRSGWVGSHHAAADDCHCLWAV